MQPLIGVIGARACPENIYQLAYQTGTELALNDFGVVCGGLGGVMEAAAKGCKEAGGLTVGIIPDEHFESANSYIDIIIPTVMGIMRNLLVVRSALGIIAIDGKFGTLSELAYALQLHKPIVGLNTWDVSEDVRQANSPGQAVQVLISLLNQTD